MNPRAIDHSAPARPQHGQAMVEYLVGLALLTALIFAANAGEQSAIDQFLAAVRTAYLKFFTAIALPI